MLRPIYIARRSPTMHAVIAQRGTTACGLLVPPGCRQTIAVPLSAGHRKVLCRNCLYTLRGGQLIAPWTVADLGEED